MKAETQSQKSPSKDLHFIKSSATKKPVISRLPTSSTQRSQNSTQTKKTTALEKTNDVSVMKMSKWSVQVITEDLQVVVLPRFFFPEDIKKGSIVRFSAHRNSSEETKRLRALEDIQQELLETLEESSSDDIGPVNHEAEWSID